MPKKSKSFREWRNKQLEDPQRAAHYVNAALNDSPEAFLIALRNVAESRRMAAVAADAGLSRESLYRTLSEEGNPTLSSLVGILKAVGLTMNVGVSDLESISDASDVYVGTGFVYGDEVPQLALVQSNA